MQQITISGTLLNDAEQCKDKNGKYYVRFKVTCGDQDINGRVQFTHYHCTCYLPGFEELKKGDQIFVTGKLSAKAGVSNTDGKAYLNLNVMVYQATGGYKQEEKKTKPISRS